MKKKFRALIAVFLASIATILIGLSSDLFIEIFPFEKNLLTIIILVLCGIFFWAIALKISIREIRTVISPPIPLVTEEEKIKFSKKGIIAFVSLYRNFKIPPDELEIAIDEMNFELLDIENSNLAPALEAIITHSNILEHCWLISTTSQNSDYHGSLKYAKLIEKYLKEVKGLKCNFHSGVKYSIPLDHDVLITDKTNKKIDEIFEEAKKEYNLKQKDIICDITSGIRSMSLGMILSCVDGSRDIQFVGANYNKDGEVIREKKTPIIIKFKAEIIE